MPTEEVKEAAEEVRMGEDVECELLPPLKIDPKLKHSTTDKTVNFDEMLAARESKMPEVKAAREEQIKRLNEQAEEHRKKADEWVRKIAARVGNKITLQHNGETEAVLSISGTENIERLGIAKCAEGTIFALQIVKIGEKNCVPTFDFKLVDITDRFGGAR